MPEPDISQSVTAVVRECMGAKPGEQLLVVCNPATQSLGQRLRDAAAEAGAEALLLLMDERETNATEPPGVVAAAMIAADIVLCPTEQSLSHTAARRLACEAGARIATLPGATEEMLARVMSADMAELRRRGRAVADALDTAHEARITCANGSDLRLDLTGRIAIPDAGELTESGAFGNLPCGEGFIAPLDGEGVLVVDGTIAAVGIPSSPITLTIEDGHLTKAEGGPEGDRLMELLTAHGADGTNVAELGIGTNEKAILTANVLEDEKILGTCHVAFGASAAIGGKVQVPIHLDVVVMRPDVSLDGDPIIRDGTLLV